MIVQQPATGVTGTPFPAATNAGTSAQLSPIIVGRSTPSARESAKANVDDGPGMELNKEIRTIVGSLRHDANSNIWRLRHIGNTDDDQKVYEVVLKGIEPYANSLRDRMTVSIRGELTNRTKNSEMNVAEVNIVGQ